MSAAEIIEQIKTLPAGEKERVLAFLRATAGDAAANKDGVDESAREAGEWVVKNYGELLQKLAQ
jgi:hypothetical protein